MAIPTLSPPSSGNIDFTYSDTDVHLKELAELYSYNEELDFTVNRTSFEELMEDYGYPLKWTQTAHPGAQVSAPSAAPLPTGHQKTSTGEQWSWSKLPPDKTRMRKHDDCSLNIGSRSKISKMLMVKMTPSSQASSPVTSARWPSAAASPTRCTSDPRDTGHGRRRRRPREEKSKQRRLEMMI